MWCSSASSRPARTAAARIRDVVLFLAGASLIAILSCHTDTAAGKTYMEVRGDASWLQFDTLQVILEDASGQQIAVLFDRRLLTLGELSKLPAEEYAGQSVRILIIGKKDGAVVYKEERVYDGRATVTRDTLVKPPIKGGPKILDLQPDNLTLFVGGGRDSLQANPLAEWVGVPLVWTTSDTGVVTVSGPGILEPKGVGSVFVQAAGGNVSDQSRITVVRDVPVLDAGAADTAILINSTLAFQVKATQAYGIIAAFAWDLDGDGIWDDSTTAVPKEQNRLFTAPHTYSKAEKLVLRFYVRDGEGNVATASKVLTVTDKVPVLDSLSVKPAVINIRDSVTFAAVASVAGGALMKFAWDYDGDGASDDSGSLTGSRASIRGGSRYPDSGAFQARLQVTDASGTSVTGRVTLQVRLDRPAADAGPDISAGPGASVTLHGTASDTMGQIERKEWKIGAGPGAYAATASGDTTFLAPAAGSLMCYFRAVDDDGLTAVDSVKVTVTSAKPPALSNLSPDTLVSIRDSLTFSAKAQAGGSSLKSFIWDFGNDGVADLSGNLTGDIATVTGGHRFPAAGAFTVVLMVSDEAGHSATVQMVVTVRQDLPFANAGSDTTVSAGSLVKLHGTARDTLGSIVKREWKIGTAAFATVSGNDTTFTAPSGIGAITCIFQVTDDDGQTASDAVQVTVGPSANADLSKLVPSAGTLNPPFTPATTEYAISVIGDIADTLSLTPTAAHSGASIKLVNWTVATGTASIAFTLQSGQTNLPVEVTAEDGITVKTYMVTVTRTPATLATLKMLTVTPETLDPPFSPTGFAYTVNTSESTLTVTAEPSQFGCTMVLENYGLVANLPSNPIQINPGTKDLLLTVTAEDRKTKLTYVITVNRP